MLSATFKTLVPVLLGVLFVAVVVSAQSILGPGAPPPYTTDAPVTMDSVYQDKNGNFQAGDIHVDSAFCIGIDCKTSWAGTGAPICKIETRRVDASSPGYFAGTGSAPNWGNTCFDHLTAAAKAAGWVQSGMDNCVSIGSRDCQPPSTCIFTRLTCSGSIVADPAVYTGPLNFPVTGFTKGTTYVCSDTIDNDNDGLTDFPDDPDCFDATWVQETPLFNGGGGGGGGGGDEVQT